MILENQVLRNLNCFLHERIFQKLFIFLPTPNETPILPIIENSLLSKEVYVPTYQKGRWEIAKLLNTKNLEQNQFGILQPGDSKLSSTRINDLKFLKDDICIVPGLLFSRNFKRLGHGGGTYDKYLENSKSTKVGITLEKTLIGNIPQNKTDIRLDVIITEKRIYETGRGD